MPRPRTGTLVRRADGSHRARITVANGKRPWVDVPKGATPNQARAFAASVSEIARDEGGVAVGRARSRTETVRAWCERWLADKERRGHTSVPATRSLLENHILPVIGDLPISTVSRRELERIVERLDQRVTGRTLKWKSAQNAWGAVTKMFDDASRTKVLSLRVRDDNPARDVRAPDRGVGTAKVHLYPDELAKLLACTAVPQLRRRYYAVAVYNYLRPGELETLRWEDVDLDRKIIQVQRGIDRSRGEEKSPKAGRARSPFEMEPEIVPLLEAMRRETDGTGRLFEDLGDERTLAERLRADLLRAGVTRKELHERCDDPPREWLRMHDLRTTGITWMAVRGDEPFVVMARAGHSDVKTTMGYINTAALVRTGYGEVFPKLPASLLESSNETSKARRRSAQPIDIVSESGGSAWESNPPAAP